jgi:flagellar basal-body rod protein FlgB
MFESLDVLRTSAQLARHAGARQAIAAVNTANADTPGYRAQALPSFAEAFHGPGPRATRPGHMTMTESPPMRAIDAGGEASPNGNTVSLEAEMFASAEASREQGRALAVWRHGLTVLRTSLGR